VLSGRWQPPGEPYPKHFLTWNFQNQLLEVGRGPISQGL